MRTLAWIGAALVVGFGSGAAAQGVSPEVALTYMDGDHDGKVMLNDYLNLQLPKLAVNDLDRDGMLTYKEFKEALEGRAKQNAEASFKMFDTESVPRKLTQREFLGYHAFVFNNILDTDHDDILSVKELGRIMASGR